MSTIKDVAEMAGVSPATVSNYLNHTRPVSKDASHRIQKAIDSLSYTQNMNARNLKTKVNTDIGVILPSLNDSYYVQIFQGIKSFFQNTGYHIDLSFSENIPEAEMKIVRSLLKKQICGLILIPCQPDKWKFYYDNVISKGIPLVLIDRNIYSLDTNFVSFDNRVLLRDMTETLLKQNYKNVCLISGPAIFDCESESVRGVRDAYAKLSFVPNENLFIETDMSKEDAFRKTLKL